MPVFPGTLRSKLPHIGETIFTTMSRLANEHNAINLSQGFPNFNCSNKLISLVNESMKKGYNQYSPMEGVMALRELIAEKTEFLYGAKYHPETEITVTPGATAAIYSAIAATVSEGDEVILFTPAYDSYAPGVELAGGQPIYIQLKTPEYRIDFKELKKVINQRTKMIIFNTPHNPTGSVFTKSDLIELEKLIGNTDVLLISDEVYEHIIFDEAGHQSAALFEKLRERSFIISSFGKTFHITGWKLGYCIAPAKLMKEFRKAHQFISFCSSTPMQYAMAEYMKDRDSYLELSAFFKQKRDFFCNAIKESRFKLSPAKGTYFQLADYSTISDERDMDLAIRLTKEYGLAAIPVSVFYNKEVDNKVLRFCFAKTQETLEKAAEIICRI